MIERSLVYIHALTPQRRFVGCGTLVEGGYVATCRHVLQAAIGKQQPVDTPLAVEVEFPHAYKDNATINSGACLADPCLPERGPTADLVLLVPDEIPAETMMLQLARHDRFETGLGYALIGLIGRDAGKPNIPEDYRIEGMIADHRRPSGLRQFTGINDTSYWSGRGSSGSPVFVAGQQLAGILCKSELGANEGKSSLREAFVVPATTIYSHLVRAVAERAAKTQHVPVSALRPVLEALGAQDIVISEIPGRIRQFVEAARARGAEPVQRSNDGADIDAVIGAARQKLSNLDAAGARALLQAKIDEEETARLRRMVPLLKERAAIERLAFDHDAAKLTFEHILHITPEDVWAHIALGDLWRTTGDLHKAVAAYQPIAPASQFAKRSPAATRPTPNGSATFRSATRGSATC